MNQILDNFGKIGVLMGGYSSERDISLKSGQAIYQALNEEGCDVVALDIIERDHSKILTQLISANIDIAFIALHGALGEDGQIQSMLEQISVVYTGSGAKASQISIDKTLTQNLLKKSNINIPSYVNLSRGEKINERSILEAIGGFPMVAKPASEGSSIGIHIIEDLDHFPLAIDNVWQYGPDVLIEKFIKGRELTVGILEQDALPVIEICSKRNFFDFTAKYESGMTDYFVPADLQEEISKEVQSIALKVHNILECQDISRIDFILDQNSIPYVLEVNTIPGFTATSLVPKAAQSIGIPFNQLCLKLVRLAHAKKKKENNSTVSY